MSNLTNFNGEFAATSIGMKTTSFKLMNQKQVSCIWTSKILHVTSTELEQDQSSAQVLGQKNPIVDS